jgi:hypothetical protein
LDVLRPRLSSHIIGASGIYTMSFGKMSRIIGVHSGIHVDTF